VLTTHYLEEAQQRADRIGLMHRGTLRREGTVAELTRALPAVIRFSLAAGGPALPLQATADADGKVVIETLSLQKDLHVLLGWAQDHALELRGLEAGPTRLDDVFRSLSA
ncbi:MAG: ABC transporter ATP-binding protein, partial [Actinoplanes sp.]